MSDRYRFGPFDLDAAEHSLLAQGRPVALLGVPSTRCSTSSAIPAGWSPATS